MQVFSNTIFRKKAFLQELSLKTPLDRCLGTFHLTFLSIAHVCGAGLYVLTGSVIRNDAGPATCISYMIGALSAVFTALCYAELATLIPKAGSCYTYTYIFIGELPAFFVGWALVSDYVMGMASVAKAFSGTVNAISNNAIQNYSMKHIVQFHNDTWLDKTLDWVAFAFILLLILITMTGAKSTLTFNGVVTVVQLILLTTITVASFVLGHVSNWTLDHGFFPFGLNGVIRGAGITVFAFSGFDALANASEEAREPRKSIPRALFYSLSFITFIYVFASLGITYLVPWREVDYAAPFVRAFEYANQPVFKWIAATATLLSTGAAKVSSMYTVPRMFYAMASDGLLFGFMASVWSVTKVPLGGLFVGGLLAAALALVLSIRVLAELTTFGVLISYFTIGVNLMLLKYNPHYAHESRQMRKQQNVSQEEKGDPNKMALFNGSMESDSTEMENEAEPYNPYLRKCIQGANFQSLRSLLGFYIILLLHVIFIFVFAILTEFTWNALSWWLAIILVSFINVAIFFFLCCYRPCTFGREAFSAPWMPLTPSLTIFINALLLTRLPGGTWLRGFIWLAIGAVIYFTYGIFHSHLRQVSPQGDTVPLIPPTDPTPAAEVPVQQSLSTEQNPTEKTE